tara:strand:- start:586 stop:1290 length:705 start_codon:yes stop_codon:yes gene_type:complete
MVDVDRAVIARLKKAGKEFEILVDCDASLDYKKGKNLDLATEVMATKGIFKDVKKGLKASEEDVKSIFGNVEENKIAETIIKEGEIQLTSKHREAEREEKKKRIINTIHRNAVDSTTGLPHPPQRIESAMNEAGIHVDMNKKAEDQVEEVLKKLRVVIPIKFEKKEIEVRIPAQYAGQAYGVIKKHKLMKDEWLNDGSLLAVLEIPSGVLDEFFDSLNKISHGEVESKIIRIID